MGEEVPDVNSLRDRKPLCNRGFGAGRPKRKCSSSASVPLSLAGVDSFVKEGKGDKGSVLSPDPATDAGVGADEGSALSARRCAAWGMSDLR